MLKTAIRDEMLIRRRQMSEAECVVASQRAQDSVAALAEFRRARAVALYSPIHNEVFTEALFRQARLQGCLVALPRVRPGGLDFVLADRWSDLHSGAFGVLEPVGADLLDPAAIDLIVVPGLAFDRAGYRLGYGKGFYDRALHSVAAPGPLKVGLCFGFQVVDVLPAERHDVRMDLIVTEDGVFRLGEKATLTPSL